MPFHFKRKESVAKAMRRLCRERIETALGSLRKDHLNATHDVRKEIKKLRSILRLVREEIAGRDYRKFTKALRQVANCLSAPRDAQVTLNAFENLTRHFSHKLPSRPFPKIKRSLQKNFREEEKKFLKDDSIVAVDRILHGLKRHAGDLKIESDGWAAIGPGLKASYNRGQEALAAVWAESTAENFHEWRKRVKDLWHHLRMLGPVWPKELRRATDELETLGEFLGDDHDLAMLKEFLADARGKTEGAKLLNELVESYQEKLRSMALKCGAKLFAGKPVTFCRRFESYWKAWRGEK